jgi:signal transduction histidine kinase/CheY-like chemotaxis protein/HPt (histidine-containing phosphotransfer) domain-containing protein
MLLGGLALGVLARAPAAAEQGRPLITAYGTRDTGGTGVFWTGVQDDAGVLYFGCDAVVRYDGEHWTQHPVPGSYAVRALAVGAHGRLWVGATDQLGYFDATPGGDLSAYHSLNAHLPNGAQQVGDVWHVFARGEGAVFVTSDEVLVWDGRQFATLRLPGTRRLAATEVGGAIYVSHQTTGVSRLEGLELRPVIPAAALQYRAPLWIERHGDRWLVASPAGLQEWPQAGDDASLDEASDFIRRNVLTSVHRAVDGTLWIGTLDQGIAVFDGLGHRVRELHGPADLPSASVMFLRGDRDGAVWIGSSLGVARIVAGAVSLFDSREGLAGQPCHHLSAANSQLVAATDNGVFELPLGDGSTNRFTAIPALPSNYHDLVAQPDGVYVASLDGVHHWDGTRVEPVFRTQRDVFVFRPSAVHAGAFHFGDEDDVVRLARNERGGFTPTVLAHLPDTPLGIAEDPAGVLWVGTRSGVTFRVPARAGAAFEPVTAPPATGPSFVGRVGGAIAVVSAGGVRLFDGGNPPGATVPGAPAWGATAVSNTAPDGSVWIAFNSPFVDGNRLPLIGRLAPGGPTGARWQPMTVAGVARIGGVRALLVDPRGVLWIGGPDGLLRLQPEQIAPASPPHAPVLQTSVLDGDRIPYRRNSVRFRFAAVEYGHRDSVRFQTRLLGSDADWSEPRNGAELALAGLRDGAYEFAVRTISDAGLTSTPVVRRFRVLPPWYRTKLAYAGWSVLALLGFAAGVQWRSAYLRRQNARLEALIQRKTAQLEKANAAKSEFLANMSHEIRNPISGIVGLSIAMEETTLDTRQRELTDSIRSCAALLATLVDDVLDFAKIEAGSIELRPAGFDLRSSLEQCITMVAEDARRTRTPVQLTIAPSVPPRLVGDAARIQQIVLNYLTNAVKFGPGRPVSVEATAAPNGRVRLAVSDRGPGMSAADAATLFTKFSRLEHARHANIRGTGLGLAVCRLLAGKMGGAVGVESQPGIGSVFWVELPLAPDPGSISPAAEPPVPAARLRALVVEDIAYNATAMQAVLRRLGVDADVAADGPSALQQLQSGIYDVAFMDWSLPGMIGTEVVRRFRAVEPAGRRTIIIATTAYSGEFNREACLEAGMDAFIAKPFTPEKIAAALRDLRGSLRAAASVVVGTAMGAPPPTPAAASGEIDLQMLRFLADGSPAGLAVQIDRYLEAFAADRQRLEELLARGENAELHRVAHRLVSHASAVRYDPLVGLARALQANAASPDRAVLHQLHVEFEAEYARFRSKLDSLRSSA